MTRGKPIRKSVPTQGVARWWEIGWLYVMPDFDRPNHSIIEWNAPGEPREPGKGHANDNEAEKLRALVDFMGANV